MINHLLAFTYKLPLYYSTITPAFVFGKYITVTISPFSYDKEFTDNSIFSPSDEIISVSLHALPFFTISFVISPVICLYSPDTIYFISFTTGSDTHNTNNDVNTIRIFIGPSNIFLNFKHIANCSLGMSIKRYSSSV